MQGTRWLVTVMLGSLLIGGCGPMEEEGPGLPGTETMSFEVNMVKQLFNSGSTTSSTQSALTDGGDDGSGSKWFQYEHVTNAIIRGGIASVVIGAGAAPHVIAWGAALGAGFQWDPQAQLFRSTTTVTLYGKQYALMAEAVINPLTNQNSYKMFVDGKLLTTGTSDFYLTAGTWELYDPNRPVSEKVVEVTWDHTGPTHTVSGLVVDPTSSYQGTNAKLARTGTLYVLTVDVQPNNQNYFEIAIDSQSNLGSILAQGYNSGAKGCWDNSFKDTTCP